MKNFDHFRPGQEVRLIERGLTVTIWARYGGPVPTYRVQLGNRVLDSVYTGDDLVHPDDPDRVVGVAR